VPRLNKTASAALAALVVAVAATVTSLASSAGTTGGSSGSSTGSSSGASTGGSAASGATPTTAVGAAASGTSAITGATSGGPAAAPPLRTQRSVLFVGRSPDLNPRGGTAKSFACRAAARLGWTCHVSEGARVVVPNSIVADVVVVALVPGDDATRVGRLLDALPDGTVGARVVLLGPIAVSRDPAQARRFAGVRRMALARGTDLVDPVVEGWLTSDSRSTFLTPGEAQLTGPGHLYVGGRLADTLGALVGE
jgi:hypothetical protein